MPGNEEFSFVGQRLSRKEDRPLVRGEGTFVADLKMPGTLAVAFVRSPVARARIISVDISAAQKVGGVAGIYTASDLQGKVKPFRLVQERIPDKLRHHPRAEVEIQPCNVAVLADGHVSYVGQPVVAIVAEDRYLAKDAAELVDLAYEENPPIVDPGDALREDAELVDEATPGNVAARLRVEIGDVEMAFRDCPRRLQLALKIGRIAAAPMEARGVVAMHSAFADELTVWSSTQVPHIVRSAIARQLGTAEDRVRVVAPHVGGGFGCKVHVYPEEILIPHLARELGRPVSWIEDRQEHLTSTAHGRDQTHTVDVAFDDDGVIHAIRDKYVLDCGVGLPYPLSSAYNTFSHLRGMYHIPNMSAEGICVLTNKVFNVPYRGSGRPEASFVIDRILNEIARRLGLDPVEVMRRNIIPYSEMPYTAGMPYRDGEEIVYDGCDMAAVLDATVAALDGELALTDGASCQKDAVKRRGIGFGTYTEGSGVGPFEGGRVMLDSAGRVVVYSGCAPHGQGLDTTISQVIADEFQVKPQEVVFRAGDTSLLPYGVGTFASRSTVTAGSAALIAARRLKDRISEIAGELLEASPRDLEVAEGRVRVRGDAAAAVSLQEVYEAAVPGPAARIGANKDPGAADTYYFVPPTVTWGYGIVAAVVSVDIETGVVGVEKLVTAHDCGRIINPLIVEGQVDGGLIQGLGAALYESIEFDERGTPLSATFMDYMVPTSAEVPQIIQNHIEIPSERNPLGVKGVGESGTIAPPSAIVNAISNALGPDLRNPAALNSLPIRPEDVLAARGNPAESMA